MATTVNGVGLLERFEEEPMRSRRALNYGISSQDIVPIWKAVPRYSAPPAMRLLDRDVQL
jgi:hypothetical protein